MQNRNYFGSYKGNPRLVLFLGPLLAIALCVLIYSTIAIAGGFQNTVLAPQHFVGVLFGGVFVVLFTYYLVEGHYIGAEQTRDKARKAAFPNEPWLWPPQWHTKDISPRPGAGRSDLIIMTLLALTFLAMTIAIIRTVIIDQKYLAAIGLIFPGAIFYACYRMIKAYRHAKAFQGTVFRMLNRPAPIGHLLQGHLVLTDQPPKGDIFRVSLRNKVIKRSRNEKTETETVLWEDAQDVPVSAGAYSTHFRLPVTFKLPKRGHSSDWSDPNEKYLWELNVRAKLPGTDYNKTFELPVYDPQEFDFHVPAALSEQGEIAAHIYQDIGDWRDTRVNVSTTVEGQTYECPPAAPKITAVASTILTLIMFSDQGLLSGAAHALFLSPFLLFLGYIALDAWFSETNFVVRKGQLDLRHGLFARKRTNLSLDDITGLVVELYPTFEPGSVYYAIFAKRKNGKPLKLANFLKSKRDTTALRDKIAEEIGL